MVTNCLRIDARAAEDLASDLSVCHHAQKEVPNADLRVVHPFRRLKRRLQSAFRRGCEWELSVRDGVAAAWCAREYALAQPRAIHTKTIKHLPKDLPRLCQAREQDVLAPDVVNAQRLGLSACETHDLSALVIRISEHGRHLRATASWGASAAEAERESVRAIRASIDVTPDEPTG